MRLASILAALTLMVGSCQSVSNGAAVSERGAFCSLQEAHEAHGKEVRITAFLETDLFHGMYLKDPGCPSFMIRLGAHKEDATPRVQEFMDEIYRNASVGRVRYRIDVSGSYVTSEAEQAGGVKRRFHLLDVASYELVSIGDDP